MTNIELESFKDSLKKDVDNAKRLENLLSNPDYIEFITEGFLKQYALYNLRNSTDSRIPLAQREDYLFRAKSTGVLTQYIAEVFNRANLAQNQLKEIDEEING